MRKTSIGPGKGTIFSPQIVREPLNSGTMRVYLGLVLAAYAVTLITGVLAGTEGNLLVTLFTLLTQGFVAAQCVMLYQRKESQNFRQLSVYCLIGGIFLTAVALFLGAVVLSLAMGVSSGQEEIVEIWNAEGMSQNMPAMIVTVVQTAVSAAALFFIRLALRQGADILERKRTTERNWFRVSAIMQFVSAVLLAVLVVLALEGWLDGAVQAVTVAKEVCLGLLFCQAAQQFKANSL